jgi:hypothetical protein
MQFDKTWGRRLGLRIRIKYLERRLKRETEAASDVEIAALEKRLAMSREKLKSLEAQKD